MEVKIKDDARALEDKKINVAKMLSRLAILKHSERSEKEIAYLSEYLSEHFTFKEIAQVCEYKLQRSPYFPGIHDFFEVLRPTQDMDKAATMMFVEFRRLIQRTGEYHLFKKQACPEFLAFVEKLGWVDACHAKENHGIEIFKSILNRPEFFLSTMGAKLENLIE